VQIPGSRRRPSIISEVTEIPEHLLKRSRERRSAIGQGGDAAADAPADAAAGANTPATTPATTTPAAAPAASGPPARTPAPTPAAPPPPKPDPVYVQAAKQRRKIPFWAMATLSLMPLWAFMYVRAVTEPAEVVEGPLGIGAEIYSSCASCHGAAGGGGVGYAFSGGTVLETFPNIEDQIRYVHYGTEGYNAAGVDIYGNPDREGGPHLTGGLGVMPAFGGQLTQYEIVSVVCHERYSLGGADPTSEEWADEYETWCSEESPVFAELQAGTYDYTSPDAPEMGGAEIMPIGPEAIAGSPASAG
jgi:mono/diheme cytochrome c family protein